MTADLLDDIDTMITKYVAFPSEHHSIVVSLWILHTWVVNAFYVTPRLIWDSAEPGSGKTRGLELLALLCRSAKLTLSTSTAALYRRIAAAVDEGLPPPTVLQDEADAIFGKNSTPQSEDLRALFNAGYRKGATVDRCEGDAKNMKVREFPVHAPVSLAGLAGKMPDTIKTRGITIHMRRRRPDQKVADFRERNALAEAAPIRDRLAAWAEQHQDALADAIPPMPDGVTDRAAEIWEPLIAIADLAGDTWATKARAACTYFVVASASDDEKLSLGQRLLRDIKKVFDTESTNAMWSSDIIAKLTSDPESEWRDLWGKTLDQRRLAKEMSKYGVKSKTVRVGVATSRGYDIEGPTGLQQAWDHWLTPSMSDTSDTADTSQVEAFHSVSHTNSRDTSDTEVTQQKTLPEQGELQNVSLVSDVSLRTGSPSGELPGVCPDCTRAPARSDTGRCDFCTAKHRRQQHLSCSVEATDTRVSKSGQSCPKWLAAHIADLQNAGYTTTESSALHKAGKAAGHSTASISNAITANPTINETGRRGLTIIYDITGRTTNYTPLPAWVRNYVDTQIRNGNTDIIDKHAFKKAATDANHNWESAARYLRDNSGLIAIEPSPGADTRKTIWRIIPTSTTVTDEEAGA